MANAHTNWARSRLIKSFFAPFFPAAAPVTLCSLTASDGSAARSACPPLSRLDRLPLSSSSSSPASSFSLRLSALRSHALTPWAPCARRDPRLARPPRGAGWGLRRGSFDSEVARDVAALDGAGVAVGVGWYDEARSGVCG